LTGNAFANGFGPLLARIDTLPVTPYPDVLGRLIPTKEILYERDIFFKAHEENIFLPVTVHQSPTTKKSNPSI
jgi:hypothetical protein